MKPLKDWVAFLKEEHPVGHKLLTFLYFVAPIALLVLGRIDQLPYVSTDSPSILSSIVLGEAILFISHVTTAGTLFSFSQGQSEKATTVACYGGLTLLLFISLVP